MEKSGTSAVLVAGATGLLGTEICRRLRSKDQKVRAFVRKSSSPEKVAALINMGVETIPGDLKDRESVKGLFVVFRQLFPQSPPRFQDSPEIPLKQLMERVNQTLSMPLRTQILENLFLFLFVK